MGWYLYRNADDSLRFVVHKRPRGGWDVDVWSHERFASAERPAVTTFSSEAGDLFPTKKEARAWAEEQAGSPLVSLPASKFLDATDGWRVDPEKVKARKMTERLSFTGGPFAPFSSLRK